jgi:hypothetical protein
MKRRDEIIWNNISRLTKEKGWSLTKLTKVATNPRHTDSDNVLRFSKEKPACLPACLPAIAVPKSK